MISFPCQFIPKNLSGNHLILSKIKVFPEDCEWNDWQIGECSQSCNGGTRTNTRTKRKEAAHGGVCVGEASMQESCNTQSCPRKLTFQNKWEN